MNDVVILPPTQNIVDCCDLNTSYAGFKDLKDM